MLRTAEPTICRIRHKNAYVAIRQFVSFDWRPTAAAISFSAHEVLFEGSFLLGKVAQFEANDSVYQRYAGSFRFCTIAKDSKRKHLLRVPNRGTQVREAEMYHTFSAVR